MFDEEIIINEILATYISNGKITENEISDVCDEYNLPISRTANIIEKILSKGVKIEKNYSDIDNRKSKTSSSKNKINDITLNDPLDFPLFTNHYENSIKGSVDKNNTFNNDNIIFIELGTDKGKDYYNSVPLYVQYKNEEKVICDTWTDLYTNTMSILAKKYNKQLESWSIIGKDIYKTSYTFKPLDQDLVSISHNLFVKKLNDRIEILAKIVKYINVCNEKFDNFKVAIKNKSNYQINKSQTITQQETYVNDNLDSLNINSTEKSESFKTDNNKNDNHEISLLIKSIKDELESKLAEYKSNVINALKCDNIDEALVIFKNSYNGTQFINTTFDLFNKIEDIGALSGGNKDVFEEIRSFLTSKIIEKSESSKDIIQNTNWDTSMPLLKSINEEIVLMKKWIKLLEIHIINQGDFTKTNTFENNNTKSFDEDSKVQMFPSDRRTSFISDQSNKAGLLKYNLDDDFTYKKIKYLVFQGIEYTVRSMSESVSKIIEILYNYNSHRMKQILDVPMGRNGNPIILFSKSNRSYFYKKIPNTDVYVRIRSASSKEMKYMIRVLTNLYNINASVDLYFYVENNPHYENYVK